MLRRGVEIKYLRRGWSEELHNWDSSLVSCYHEQIMEDEM
jgi:hypothetical protein